MSSINSDSISSNSIKKGYVIIRFMLSDLWDNQRSKQIISSHVTEISVRFLLSFGLSDQLWSGPKSDHVKRRLLLYYLIKCKAVFIKLDHWIEITSTLSVAASTQKWFVCDTKGLQSPSKTKQHITVKSLCSARTLIRDFYT